MENGQATEQAPPLPDREPTPSGTSGAGVTSSRVADLSQAISRALESIEVELGTRTWLFTDPERRKALSRARDFLQRMSERLDLIADGRIAIGSGEISAAVELVRRSSETKRRYGRENAWDLAEEMRVTGLSLLPDEAIVCLLENEQEDSEGMTWTQVFPRAELDRLLTQRGGRRPPGQPPYKLGNRPPDPLKER
jgi:hypothetical protein